MTRARDDAGAAADHPLLVAYVIVAHAVILTAIFWSIYSTPFADVPIYQGYATKLLAGLVPYRDFAMEYPPGALIFFTLPHFVSRTLTQYYVAFRVEVIVFDVLVILALNAMARRRGASRTAVLGAYTAFVLTVGPIIGQVFDIFPAALVVFALYFATREEWGVAGMMLGLGIVTKLYPLLLVPAFALPLVHRRDYRQLVRYTVFGCAGILLVAAPLLVVVPTHVLDFLKYHSARGVHVESVYGSLFLLLDKVRLAHVGIAYNFSSWNLSGPGLAIAKPLSSLALLAAVIAAYAATWRRTREPDDLVESTLVILVAAMVTSKVLSPQYLMWLMPLVPLALMTRPEIRQRLWLLFGAAGVLSYYIFPLRYMALVTHKAIDAEVALLLRNVMLVLLIVVLYRGMKRDVQATAPAA